MANIVLIHGANQDAWCWREVALRLRSQGHQITATDLPGRGDDPKRPENVTQQDYVDAIVGAFDSSNEHTILVGHSAAGVWISQAAEVAPDKISALVYVAGALLPNGLSLVQAIDGLDPQYLAQLVWAPDRRTVSIRPEGAVEFLLIAAPPGSLRTSFRI